MEWENTSSSKARSKLVISVIKLWRVRALKKSLCQLKVKFTIFSPKSQMDSIGQSRLLFIYHVISIIIIVISYSHRFGITRLAQYVKGDISDHFDATPVHSHIWIMIFTQTYSQLCYYCNCSRLRKKYIYLFYTPKKHYKPVCLMK